MKRVPCFAFIGFFFLLCVLSGYGSLLFENSEYVARRAKLMDKIPDGAVIIRGAQLRTAYNEYFQNNNFIYFSGVEVPDAVLLIDGKKRESVLFFTITEREARNEGINLEMVRRPVETTGIEKVCPIEEFTPYLANLAVQGYTFYTPLTPQELMRECTREKLRSLRKNMVYYEWDGRLTRELQFVKHLRDRFPQTEVKDCSRMIWDLRMIKSPVEIAMLRKAARIGVKAHIELMKTTRVGMKEYELAALYEFLCKKEGAQDLAYYMIMCSAENHSYVHYYKHDRVLEEGDFLVVDVGPDYGYYDVDITISYPANGKFTPRQRELYQAVLAVHQASLSVYRPGITLEEVQYKVNEILIEQGYDLAGEVFQKRNMQGRFGHFVGLAVHDVGGGPSVLKPGMVFANEPYAVFPEENLGVRVENTILITENGCENLTAGIPREIEDIEALMKKKGMIQHLKEKSLY